MKSLQAKRFNDGTKVEVFCPQCQHVWNKGEFVILVHDADELIGFVSDSEMECCGQPLVAPKVFDSLSSADLCMRLLLNARRIEVLPMSMFA
ncbi:MAG: hypothetical protein Q7S86_00810 [bacterium]|nr:hypothetical protein [bacterium]